MKEPLTSESIKKVIENSVIFFISIFFLLANKYIVKAFSIPKKLNVLLLLLNGYIFYSYIVGFIFIQKYKNSFILNKLRIKDAEAVINCPEDKDVLNNEMRELVYIINSSDVHTIVFEDIDRFENIDLFIKLRELNYLINTKRRGNRKKKFIYMVRDDLFISKDRTKFFDYIIPVVPVIGSQNSNSKLLELFSDLTYETKPSEIFLDKVSIYIDDMRTLYSIRHEYEIYLNTIGLKTRKLNPDKLLALIIVKNLLPTEFERLQCNRGYIQNKIKKAEILKLEKIRECKNDDDRIEINKKSLSKILLEKETKDLEIFFESDNSNRIENHNLPLLKFLILNGYIDETYKYYLGYFYEGSLGIKDEIFLRSLFDGSYINPDMELENPNKIIQRLSDLDYERTNILNYTLLTQLITKGKGKYLSKITYISVKHKEQFMSLVKFLKRLDFNNLNSYIEMLLSTNDFILVYSLVKKLRENKSSVEDNIFIKIIIILYINIEFMDKDSIELLNELALNHPRILEHSYAIEKEEFLNGLKKSGLSFEDIYEINLDDKLAYRIKDITIYKFNIKNILKLIMVLEERKDEEKTLSELFKIIYENQDYKELKIKIKPLLKDLLEEYISILINKDLKMNSGQKVFTELLNEKIPLDLAKKIINQEVNKNLILENINDINLWNELIQNDRIAFSNNNIHTYYEEFGVTELLLNYLNLNKGFINSSYISEELSNELINMNNISEEVFISALNRANEEIAELQLEDEHRILKLLEVNMMDLTEENFKCLLNFENRNLLIKYSKNYKHQFVDFIINENLINKIGYELLIDLINFSNIEISQLIKLIDRKNIKISLFNISNKDIELQKHILENYFHTDDLENIIIENIKFPLWDDFISKLNRREILFKNLKSYEFTFEFIDHIFKSNTLDIEIKISMIIHILDKEIYIENFANWIKYIPGSEIILEVFKNKKPNVKSIPEEQEHIINKLMDIKVIKKMKSGTNIYLAKQCYKKVYGFE